MNRSEFLKTGALAILAAVVPNNNVINNDLIKKWETILLFSETNAFNISKKYQCKPVTDKYKQYELCLVLENTEKILRQANLSKYGRHVIPALRRDKHAKWTLINIKGNLQLRIESKQYEDTIDYCSDFPSLYTYDDCTTWFINPNKPLV